jgi:hypothetical protein
MVLNCRSAATITGMKITALDMLLLGILLISGDRADLICRAGSKI